MLGFETMSNGGGFSHDYCLILMQGLQVASVCQSSTAALMGSGVALYLCQVPSLSLARCTGIGSCFPGISKDLHVLEDFVQHQGHACCFHSGGAQWILAVLKVG